MPDLSYTDIVFKSLDAYDDVSLFIRQNRNLTIFYKRTLF